MSDYLNVSTKSTSPLFGHHSRFLRDIFGPFIACVETVSTQDTSGCLMSMADPSLILLFWKTDLFLKWEYHLRPTLSQNTERSFPSFHSFLCFVFNYYYLFTIFLMKSTFRFVIRSCASQAIIISSVSYPAVLFEPIWLMLIYWNVYDRFHHTAYHPAPSWGALLLTLYNMPTSA